MRMSVNLENFGNSRVEPGPKDFAPGDVATRQPEMVSSRTLREVVGDKHIWLLKIDVEGYEGLVLESAGDLIADSHLQYIFLEYSPVHLRRMGTVPQSILTLVRHLFHHLTLTGPASWARV